MTADSGGFAADGMRVAIAAELAALADDALRMMLVEWKRWRARVQTAPIMRLRRQRFDEATAFIDAIELELALREPGERLRRQRAVAARVGEIAAAPIVALGDYRAARQTLARIARRHTI